MTVMPTTGELERLAHQASVEAGRIDENKELSERINRRLEYAYWPCVLPNPPCEGRQSVNVRLTGNGVQLT